MNIRSVCILGGAGFVGSRIAARLAERALNVRVVTRNRERAKSLLVLPTVEVVEPPTYDVEGLATVFRGTDAVINLVGILHEEKPGDFERVHVQLPQTVIAAMRAAGVSRLLHMSALAAHPSGPSRYLRSKGEGEAVVLGAAECDPSLAVTVFRPSVIFGRGDSFLTLFARLAATFPVLPLADGGSRLQPVWVEDVARAYAASLDRPPTFGAHLNLCGPRVYTLEQLLRLAARAQGREPLVIRLSPTLSRWQAWLMELKPGRKLMTRDNHLSLSVDSVCDGDFPPALGFAPMPLEAIIGDCMRPAQGHRYAPFRTGAGR